MGFASETIDRNPSFDAEVVIVVECELHAATGFGEEDDIVDRGLSDEGVEADVDSTIRLATVKVSG